MRMNRLEQGGPQNSGALDQFSYGQVKVTSRRLTITPKNINGQRLNDDGRPCGPVVLNYSR